MRFPKRWVFLGITLLTPLLLFAVAEGIARLAWPEAALPMSVTAPFGNGHYLVAARDVAPMVRATGWGTSADSCGSTAVARRRCSSPLRITSPAPTGRT